jgi:formylglycine-generating enzyme required for sulfatase activity
MSTNIEVHRWNDRYPMHAPVGSFLANPFGLHDTVGNVVEWCQDVQVAETLAGREGDGLRADQVLEGRRVIRGGVFNFSAAASRSAYRDGTISMTRNNNLGSRPARVLH